MAGEQDFLSHLTALLRTLDDDAYASLANKGLLRRARKDLEGGLAVEVGEVDGSWLNVRVGECRVRFSSAGPSQATCSCPGSALFRRENHLFSAITGKAPSPAFNILIKRCYSW